MCTSANKLNGTALSLGKTQIMAATRTKSWLSTVTDLRCNRCRVGELFPYNTYAFKRPFDMYTHCPKCGLDYWPEPGFYYGAMFLSYMLFCFPFLGLVLVLHWVVGWSLGSSMLFLCVLASLTFVYIFRVARASWLAMNTKYDPVLSEAVCAGEVDVSEPELR